MQTSNTSSPSLLSRIISFFMRLFNWGRTESPCKDGVCAPSPECSSCTPPASPSAPVPTIDNIQLAKTIIAQCKETLAQVKVATKSKVTKGKKELNATQKTAPKKPTKRPTHHDK